MTPLITTATRTLANSIARTAFALLTMAAAVACQSSKLTAPPAGGTHVLFIGNSLTYFNNLPVTLGAMAALTGDTIRVTTVAYPDFALVDHLRDGTAFKAIRIGGWHYVVLQQGPSSLQVNRDSLIMMTGVFNEEIKRIGGKTALFSVWPQTVNYSTFPRAIESYQLAASSVNGVYLPVGAAWYSALAQNASLQLYDIDGLHPTPLGTYLAALVMYERITGKDARLLPAEAVVAGRTLDVTDATVRELQKVAHSAVASGSSVIPF